jgi:hypothetical protein
MISKGGASIRKMPALRALSFLVFNAYESELDERIRRGDYLR